MIERRYDPNVHYYDLYQLLFLLRVLRLYKAARLLRPSVVFGALTKVHQKYIDWHQRDMLDCGIATDDVSELCDIHKIDHVGIDTITKIHFGYLIGRVLFIVILLCYAIGLLFYLFVEIEEYIVHEQDPSLKRNEIESFISNYELTGVENSRATLICLYFSLTTLSSVGFGDYSPQTTPEQGFIIIVFFLQLIVFSSIINSLQTYFEDYQSSLEEPDESN